MEGSVEPSELQLYAEMPQEDLEKILELQYQAYQSEAKLFDNMDIPPLRQTIEAVYQELQFVYLQKG